MPTEYYSLEKMVQLFVQIKMKITISFLLVSMPESQHSDKTSVAETYTHKLATKYVTTIFRIFMWRFIATKQLYMKLWESFLFGNVLS